VEAGGAMADFGLVFVSDYLDFFATLFRPSGDRGDRLAVNLSTFGAGFRMAREA
jgi:hypothetical protein